MGLLGLHSDVFHHVEVVSYEDALPVLINVRFVLFFLYYNNIDNASKDFKVTDDLFFPHLSLFGDDLNVFLLDFSKETISQVICHL